MNRRHSRSVLESHEERIERELAFEYSTLDCSKNLTKRELKEA